MSVKVAQVCTSRLGLAQLGTGFALVTRAAAFVRSLTGTLRNGAFRGRVRVGDVLARWSGRWLARTSFESHQIADAFVVLRGHSLRHDFVLLGRSSSIGQ